MWSCLSIVVLALLLQPVLVLAQTRSPAPDPVMPDPCRIAPALPFCP
ncbi:MAG: hypothetical protein ACREGK_12625 [Geminicoccales bacterium]